jgi:hypothetical protein
MAVRCFYFIKDGEFADCVRASLSFFSENDTGSILNRYGDSPAPFSMADMLTSSRFSQDMQLIDKRLPMALQSVEVRKSRPSLKHDDESRC